jgi:hypothetical protein
LDGEDRGEGGRWKEKKKEKGKLKIEQLAGGVCTQQSVLGRVSSCFRFVIHPCRPDKHTQPPAVLALHLNCFMHTGFGASKNTLRTAFPELLDLTPYTTNGVLSGSLDAPVAFRAPPGCISALCEAHTGGDIHPTACGGALHAAAESAACVPGPCSCPAAAAATASHGV